MIAKATYDPLFTLKHLGDSLWIADGETIDFGFAGLTMPFPTRMTVIRLRDGLLIHSPIALAPSLKAEIDALGPVRFLIAPNRIHYWWMPEWHAAYGEAEGWLAPRIKEQAKGRIDFACRDMPADSYPWDSEIATLAVPGDYMSEMVFFHHASQTLVLTDLIENFEAEKLSWWARPLARLGGIVAPHGGTPRDMRFTLRRHRNEIAKLAAQMIALAPRRIVMAHGRIIESECCAILARTFRWALAD